MNKKILFVYDYLYTGGIETLILRMSKWLLNNDYEVTILLRKKGEIAQLIDSRVNYIELGKKYRYLYLPFFSNITLKKYDLKRYDYLMSFHPRSNWIASNIISNLKLECKYVSGVYHPRAYFNKDLHLSEKLAYKSLMNILDNKSLIFMNNETQKHHSENLKLDFNSSLIWPLPVENNSEIREIPKKFKFISIGRLAKFKTYNLYMIDIINKLISEGFDIQYDIYGTGELDKFMIEKIKKYSLESNIIMHGNLDYSNFSEVLKDAYLFVGMGTSVVEASFSKVPSLVAIENSKDSLTYGFLNDLPYYNVGEKNNDLIEFSMEEKIRKVLLMNEDEYNELSNESYDYVQAYSIDYLMPKWVNYIESLEKNNITISFKEKLLYYSLEVLNPIIKIFKKKENR